MSHAVARRIFSAWSRSASGSVLAVGQIVRANASHSARIGSMLPRRKSASRMRLYLLRMWQNSESREFGGKSGTDEGQTLCYRKNARILKFEIIIAEGAATRCRSFPAQIFLNSYKM